MNKFPTSEEIWSTVAVFRLIRPGISDGLFFETLLIMETDSFTEPWLVTAQEDTEQTYALKNRNDPDPLLDRIGETDCVLLGEASPSAP